MIAGDDDDRHDDRGIVEMPIKYPRGLPRKESFQEITVTAAIRPNRCDWGFQSLGSNLFRVENRFL